MARTIGKWLGAVAAIAALHGDAWAQRTTAVVPNATNVREEILGFDPARGVMAFVRRTPSATSGFTHVTIVEVSRDGSAHEIRLTTEGDVDQWRGAQSAPATRAAIDARVERDLASNRARYRAGTALPVATDGVTGCTRAPHSARTFTVGDGVRAEVNVSPDGSSSSITFVAGNQRSAPVEVPAVMLSHAGGSVSVPYDHVADVRQFSGTDQIGVLVRSDACTPEGTPVPVVAVFAPALPAPETPLDQLVHAELMERAVIAAVAPHARRRSVDEVTSFYDGRTRVVYDTAWHLPGTDRVLAQYTRVDPDLPPPIVDAGQAGALFAVMEPIGETRVRAMPALLPPSNENVFEGVGQEAYQVDLDGDGRPELLVRAHTRPSGEIATLLRWATDDTLQFVWRGALASDERGTVPGPADARHCTIGRGAQDLVVRCVIDHYPAGATMTTPPDSTTRTVQRLRWNGGALDIQQERQ